MVSLSDFLDSKPLYYDEIDYHCIHRAYASIKDALPRPKVIHIVGTNGKGTTGRFIANALYRGGYRVGHYTSPHIIAWNERFWLNGANIDDSLLEQAHQILYTLLNTQISEALSSFEYTTLLAMVAFEGCEWVVLEAGLGGEYDATNVFDKELSVFTPIDYDHQSFLGEDIQAIATTKLNSMGPVALLGRQAHSEVEERFFAIAREKAAMAYRIQDICKAVDDTCVKTLGERNHLPLYLQQNLALAIAALKVLEVPYRCEWFEDMPMFGRLSRLNEQVLIDVGHNALAAEAIRHALAGKQLVLVYNSYKDKAYGKILQILQPVVKRVEIIAVEDERIEVREKLEEALDLLLIPHRDFEGIEADEEYLVFGSFSVAEAFLKGYHA